MINYGVCVLNAYMSLWQYFVYVCECICVRLSVSLYLSLFMHLHQCVDAFVCLCECVNMHKSLTFHVSFYISTSQSLNATFPPSFLSFLPAFHRALCVRIQLSNLHAKRCIRYLCDRGPRRRRDGIQRWAGEQSR